MKQLRLNWLIAILFAFAVAVPFVASAAPKEDEEIDTEHLVIGSFLEFPGEPGTTFEVLAPNVIRLTSQKDGCAEFQMIGKGEGDVRVISPDGTSFLIHFIVDGLEMLPVIEKELAEIEAPDSDLTDYEDRIATPDDYAEQMLALINQIRSKRNIPPLRLSKDLTDAATIRANEIIQMFSHTRPNGEPYSSVVKSNLYAVGENLSAGKASPSVVIEEWMEEPDDRANILNAEYTELGIGFVHNRNSQLHYYWVHLFRGPIV